MGYDYDLVAIGGGVAGMVAAGVAASFGARSLLVDPDRLGGECAWSGCIPSKTLIHLANQVQAIRAGRAAGLYADVPAIDFPSIMDRVRGASEFIYEEAAHPRHMRRLGIDCERATARFLDPHRVELACEDGQVKTLTGRSFVVATGARPLIPDVPGLSGVEYLTNQSVFRLSSAPGRLLVVGAGRVGLELGQAFHRLGCRITVVDLEQRILAGDDAEHAGFLLSALKKEGLEVRLQTRIESVRREDGEIVLESRSADGPHSLRGDALLVAAGRRPNTGGLNLEAAGVEFSAKGIHVDSRCRTTAPHIYAAGDVAGGLAFTHWAEHMAKTAVMNAVLRAPTHCDRAHVTWCTFTDPEVGQLGETEQSLKEKGVAYEVHRFPYSMIDRAVTEGATQGWVKVMATRWRGKILGVSIVGRAAGEMLCEWAVTMRNGLRMRHVADTIHPYPTYGFGTRRVADQWYIRRRPLAAIRALRSVLGYRGSVTDVGKDGTPV